MNKNNNFRDNKMTEENIQPTQRFKLGDKVVVAASGTGWRKWTKGEVTGLTQSNDSPPVQIECIIKDIKGRYKRFYPHQLEHDRTPGLNEKQAPKNDLKSYFDIIEKQGKEKQEEYNVLRQQYQELEKTAPAFILSSDVDDTCKLKGFRVKGGVHVIPLVKASNRLNMTQITSYSDEFIEKLHSLIHTEDERLRNAWEVLTEAIHNKELPTRDATMTRALQDIGVYLGIVK